MMTKRTKIMFTEFYENQITKSKPNKIFLVEAINLVGGNKNKVNVNP